LEKYKVNNTNISRGLLYNIYISYISYMDNSLNIDFKNMEKVNRIKIFYVGENETSIEKIYVHDYYFDKYSNLFFFKMEKIFSNIYVIEEKELEDFHFLYKEKIFTLHHSAIQELDRRQQKLNKRKLELEERIKKIEEIIN
jgi:hypothetical protein